MKIAIAGGTGRMGQALIKAALADSRLTLAAISVRSQHLDSFVKPGDAVRVTSDPHELAVSADAVIDFTTPEATLSLAKAVAERGGVHIIGTTGFSTSQQKEIAALAKQARIVQSGNFSLGVNVLAGLVRQAARLLGDAYDIEISEMHHKHKKDAPSGTALMLGKAAAEGREVAFDTHKVMGHSGERETGKIGFSVQRGGDVVGIHSVLFAGPGEVMELKHQGFSREIYAGGALAAALWAQDKAPGLYSMQDVLSLDV